MVKASREADELRTKRITMVSRKLSKEQSASELAKEVKRARDELQDVYFENSRYRSEVEVRCNGRTLRGRGRRLKTMM